MDSTNDTAMIIGLGNPGVQYRYTRHNAGFMVAQALADKLGISLTRVKFRSQVGSGRLDGIPVIIAKPLTYMNESGSAVSSLLHYFKVPLNRLLVIHDDLDLPWERCACAPVEAALGSAVCSLSPTSWAPTLFPACVLVLADHRAEWTRPTMCWKNLAPPNRNCSK